MLTYCDVTDLVRTRSTEELATIASMTACTTGGISGRWPWPNGAGFSATPAPIGPDDRRRSFQGGQLRYGHAVGDEALVAVANACREGKRSSDIVGRLGGEEFAMLLPETDLDQARIVAEAGRQNVAAHRLEADGSTSTLLPVSGFGRDGEHAGFEALLHAADRPCTRPRRQAAIAPSHGRRRRREARGGVDRQRASALVEQFVDASLSCAS